MSWFVPQPQEMEAALYVARAIAGRGGEEADTLVNVTSWESIPEALFPFVSETGNTKFVPMNKLALYAMGRKGDL